MGQLQELIKIFEQRLWDRLKEEYLKLSIENYGKIVLS